MTKNVTVTDVQGNIIGTTYPKRASGLVKNGRAIFVDDCTIRLSGKPAPSDTYHTSEVNQMNYILFNPRNWSFEQTQYHNNNGFGNNGFYSGNNNGFTPSLPAERSFITDFDGGLVESLMFGDWDTAYVRAISKELSLLPATDYQFVFWLNGGENDKNSEICQLQIVFSGNREDCYTYKLNRNYIKPLLRKDGWELYSIPFCTPEATSAPQTTSDSTPATVTQFSFVAGKAPMAVKPAKEPEVYADWEDAPDEFASERPQRHNLVFADGWPSISQYGGEKYSTEAIRARKEAEAARQANRFSDAYHNAAENIGNVTRNAADSIKNAAQNMAQNARRMAENYKKSGNVNWKNAEDFSNASSGQSDIALPAGLTEQLGELECQGDDLVDQKDDLQNRFEDLKSRAEDLSSRGLLTADAMDSLNGRFSAFEFELNNLEGQLNSIDAQVDTAEEVIANLLRFTGSEEPSEGYLDSLESDLDAAEGHADGMDCSLDSLEEYLDSIEDTANNEE